MQEYSTELQWALVIIISAFMYFISPWARNTKDFFKGESREKKSPSVFLLTSSLVISWIFAKSISNAANLGANYGIVGGVGYASYYLSFLVGGIVIYRLRVKGAFKSIHHFIQSKFGRSAVIIFSVLIAFRLFMEVWSNTMVIGSYFGDAGTTNYFVAIIIFTVTTLAYVIKGGLKSSLWTDLIQMFLFVIILVVVLGYILPRHQPSSEFLTSGIWNAQNGLNLLFVGLIQVFSYPFHDPVLTDRGFISTPKKTLYSFIFATVIGAVCIILFSFIGIYAKLEGIEGKESAFEVSKTLGVGVMLLMNLIMITSATSTLDSTFSSFSKLVVVDLKIFKEVTISNGRIAMIIITILGTIPVFFNPEILSATTISGTMVLGLTPVFIFWRMRVHKFAFHASVFCGLIFGLILAFKIYPQSWIFLNGPYNDLLSLNIIGVSACILIFVVSRLVLPKKMDSQENG